MGSHKHGTSGYPRARNARYKAIWQLDDYKEQEENRRVRKRFRPKLKNVTVRELFK
jgi:hypothetical protein